LVGELDHPDLHERTEFLQEQIAGSKRSVIPRAGHTSNMENPEAFNRAVVEFLEASGVCRTR
jgi:pimeloyl-ACP methyl ester carboxylesterase